MICPIAPPMAAIVVPASRTPVDTPPASITWLTMLNGAATAPETTLATMYVSTRMPSTRQKPLRTNENDLVIASITDSLSSTISTGANNATVYRYTDTAITASTNGIPSSTAATPLPSAATTATNTTTSPTRAPSTAASTAAKPSRGSSRPRILAQVSPMVIDDPNTARPTMTVSMPDSSMLPNQVTSRLPVTDANQAPTTPKLGASGCSVEAL